MVSHFDIPILHTSHSYILVDHEADQWVYIQVGGETDILALFPGFTVSKMSVQIPEPIVAHIIDN